MHAYSFEGETKEISLPDLLTLKIRLTEEWRTEPSLTTANDFMSQFLDYFPFFSGEIKECMLSMMHLDEIIASKYQTIAKETFGMMSLQNMLIAKTMLSKRDVLSGYSLIPVAPSITLFFSQFALLDEHSKESMMDYELKEAIFDKLKSNPAHALKDLSLRCLKELNTLCRSWDTENIRLISKEIIIRCLSKPELIAIESMESCFQNLAKDLQLDRYSGDLKNPNEFDGIVEKITVLNLVQANQLIEQMKNSLITLNKEERHKACLMFEKIAYSLLRFFSNLSDTLEEDDISVKEQRAKK